MFIRLIFLKPDAPVRLKVFASVRLSPDKARQVYFARRRPLTQRALETTVSSIDSSVKLTRKIRLKKARAIFEC